MKQESINHQDNSLHGFRLSGFVYIGGRSQHTERFSGTKSPTVGMRRAEIMSYKKCGEGGSTYILGMIYKDLPKEDRGFTF